MPKGTPLDESRYDRLLAAIDDSLAGELHCGEVATIMGCDGRNVSARLSYALEQGLIHRVQRGRATFYRRGPNPDVKSSDLGDFEGCLCSDGELHLYGLPEANHDGSVTLSNGQRKALAEVLQGDPFHIVKNPRPVMPTTIEATLWTDGELVLWQLPQPEAETGAVTLCTEDRRLLRSLLVKP
jgi:hypothetical protein